MNDPFEALAKKQSEQFSEYLRNKFESDREALPEGELTDEAKRLLRNAIPFSTEHADFMLHKTVRCVNEHIHGHVTIPVGATGYVLETSELKLTKDQEHVDGYLIYIYWHGLFDEDGNNKYCYGKNDFYREAEIANDIEGKSYAIN